MRWTNSYVAKSWKIIKLAPFLWILKLKLLSHTVPKDSFLASLHSCWSGYSVIIVGPFIIRMHKSEVELCSFATHALSVRWSKDVVTHFIPLTAGQCCSAPMKVLCHNNNNKCCKCNKHANALATHIEGNPSNHCMLCSFFSFLFYPHELLLFCLLVQSGNSIKVIQNLNTLDHLQVRYHYHQWKKEHIVTFCTYYDWDFLYIGFNDIQYPPIMKLIFNCLEVNWGWTIAFHSPA